jgi:hypothetical protein
VPSGDLNESKLQYDKEQCQPQALKNGVMKPVLTKTMSNKA